MPVTRSQIASSNTNPWDADSTNASPLVTPDEANFPPIGTPKKPTGTPKKTKTPSKNVRSATPSPIPPSPKPTRSALKIQTVQPASLLGSSRDPPPIGTHSRERSSNGVRFPGSALNKARSREASANPHSREPSTKPRSREPSRSTRSREPSADTRPSQGLSDHEASLKDLRRMLEAMRTSPQPTPSPTQTEFGCLSSPVPTVFLSVDAPLDADRPKRGGSWSPSVPYIPPGRLNQLLSPNPGNTSPGAEPHPNSSTLMLIPRVSINDDEVLDGDQGAGLSNVQVKSLWDRVHEAVATVEKLEGPNWPSWSFWIHRKVIGVGKDIWEHIDGTSPRPDPGNVAEADGNEMDALDEWDLQEAAIYCALFSSLDFRIIHDQIRVCTTSKDLWDHLELLYREKPTPETCAMNLIRELSQAVYFEGEDLQWHLNRLIEITGELDCGPYALPVGLVASFILDSLPVRLLEHAHVLRGQNHLTIQELCRNILAIGERVLGDKCVGGPGNRLPSITERQISTSLPPDLRHYKYTGDGTLPDGGLHTRVRHTCYACLAIGHRAYSSKCPQTEARQGLWGIQMRAFKKEYVSERHGQRDNKQGRGRSLGRGPEQGGEETSSGTARTTSNGWDEPTGLRSGRTSGYSTPNPSGMPRAPSWNGKLGIVSSRPSAFEMDSWR